MQVENGSFTVLVLSGNGGMGKNTYQYYSWIAEKLTEEIQLIFQNSVKQLTIFSDDVMDLKKNSFLMMKSIIMYIRGSRSIKHEQEKHNAKEMSWIWSCR